MEPNDKRKFNRKKFDSEIEFIINEDVVKAHSVNISERGIQFVTEKPLTIELRFLIDGREIQRRARLCWAKQHDDDDFSYGLEYLEG